MIKRATLSAFLILVFSGTQIAYAADLGEARFSLTRGHYDEAVAKAELVGNIEARLLAAEALNTKILIGKSLKPKNDAKKAMAIAEQVLTAHPEHSDAKLLYAISYSFYSRSVSPIKAWRKKLPQKTKMAIIEAVAANPEDANSYALYGGWHMSVSAKAGTKTAKRSYDASIESGISNFKMARDINKDDILINANYALMLYASDPEAYGKTILPLIANISEAVPQNSAQVHVQKYIADFAAKLDQPKLALDSAEQFLDW